MLRFLKRWLGWDSDSGPFDFGDPRLGSRQKSANAAPRSDSQPPRSAAPAPAQTPTQPQAQTKDAAPKKPNKERAPMDVLDNPRLTLDRPSDDGFDPYNTGAFNRSTSWERIGRHKR